VTASRWGVAAAMLAVVVAVIIVGLVLVVRSDDDEAAMPAGTLAPVLATARPAEAPFSGLTELRLGIGGDCHRIVVADEVAERGVGLMRRRDLGPYDGMLFVFERPVQGSFTMSDVPVSLDIGWYDDAGRPVDRLVMRPCPDRSVSECPLYRSGRPYTYAVETLEGQLPAGALSGCS
jgi:uncharacterized membrane protein (UPF0127 family)